MRMKYFQMFLAVVLFSAVTGCGGSGGRTGDQPGIVMDMAPGSETAGGDSYIDLPADQGPEVNPLLDLAIPGDIDPACVEPPYAFGCPCVDNGDCESGFCVEGPFGGVCTEQCLEECPESWHCKGVSGIGPDLVFLCVPDNKKLCYPCTLDSQCGGGLCMPLGDGDFCTFTCDELTQCPATFHCEEVDEGGQTCSVCLPDSGSCACTSDTEGQLRPCQIENEHGLCMGYETCDSDDGWVDCSAEEPAAETCDGKDNDCDGAFDEDLPEFQECENVVPEIGTCDGVATCLGPGGWVCTAAIPALEICDFLDNDCDGEADEDFKVDGVYGSQNHCGTCNHDCTGAIEHADAVCDPGLSTPLCVVEECFPGFYQLSDFQCLPEGQTICKPCVEDFQCEGGICVLFADGEFCTKACEDEPCPESFECGDIEGLGGSWCVPVSGTCDCSKDTEGSTKPCSVTNDYGTCFGSQTCDPDLGWLDCTAVDASPEICDGLDNDCDGVPDDGLPQTQPCETAVDGVGTCYGIETCLGSEGWVCSAAMPEIEICDYKDNDCDDAADEDFIIDGKYGTPLHCGACNQSCIGALPNATSYCDTSVAQPDCKIDECLPGFFQINKYQCIDPPEVQCKACENDNDCYFDKCVELDDGQYCLSLCNGGVCPDGYYCADMGQDGQICVPDSGSCECSAETLGATRSCEESNGFGTCFGVETCEASGWSACDAAIPEAESCDGADNDCDGLADESLPQGDPCENENDFGACPGVSVCDGQNGWICQGQVPEAESCDYQDNDCDGTVDEDFKNDEQKYYLEAHCGTCNNACLDAIDNATGTCDDTYLFPKCVVDECDDGYAQVSPLQCVVPPDTTCQACEDDADCVGSLCVELDDQLRCAMPCDSDADCGGETACLQYPGEGTLCQPLTGSCECSSFTDEAKRSCSTSNDLGTCFGFETCDGDVGWGDCDALVPSAEICNGVDDDCNGLIDDSLPPTMPCENTVDGVGTCVGDAVCYGTEGWFCTAPVPAVESCDYQDNNCDGSVDEGYKNGDGDYADYFHCGSCTISCEAGFPNATATCDADKEPPQCVVDECDEGFFLLNEFQCVPDIAGLCESCSTDDNCVLQGAKCVDLGDGEKFCSKHCNGDEDCPDGYTCEAYDGDTQCIPDTGSCSCDGSNLDLSRSCSLTWPPNPGPGQPFTTCYGTEQCTMEGWGDCDLSSEVCDNVDNDCDGDVDEEFVNDDGKYFTDENCGQCSNNCTFLSYPNASSACDIGKATPECGMSCDPGFFDVNGNPADGCECGYVGEADSPDGVDQNCDGVDGEVGNAVFVAKNGSNAAMGTIDAPMLTIQAAIERALSTSRRDVYVATGVYSESVILAMGVQVFGGFSSDFLQRNILLYETVIMGDSFQETVPAAVNAFYINGSAGSTVLDGFTVFGANNYGSGGSSYTVYLRSCGEALQVSKNHVFAGNGGGGGTGDSGVDGPDGIGGGDGFNAFETNWNNCSGTQKVKDGGVAGTLECEPQDVSGGKGGDSYCPKYEGGPDGPENGAAGSGPGAGSGGVAGWDGDLAPWCSTCYVQTGHPSEGGDGTEGANGTHGAAGSGCADTDGAVAGGFWSPADGGGGVTGSPGGGGGGGGSGRSADASAGCVEQIGGTGGGGGSGGCQGTGGVAGTGGGGSFGLFLYFDDVPGTVPTIEDNLFEGGVGGMGGIGGNGGTGGTGGMGGDGGTDAALFCALGGGVGGDGGNGGHGGGGGGGCGGLSYCLYAAGQGAVVLDAYKAPGNTFIPGIGGWGGQGGPSVGNPGVQGQNGPGQATNF